MERSLTFSDHSTTVTTHYLSHAPYKSYGPMTQLLPGPQCHTCPNHFTSNLSLSLDPSLPGCPFTLLIPSFLSCIASLFLSTSRPLHHHLPNMDFFSHAHASVCLSICLLLFSSPLLPLCIHVASSLSFMLCLCNICLV